MTAANHAGCTSAVDGRLRLKRADGSGLQRPLRSQRSRSQEFSFVVFVALVIFVAAAVGPSHTNDCRESRGLHVCRRWWPRAETSRRQRATKATKITKIAKPSFSFVGFVALGIFGAASGRPSHSDDCRESRGLHVCRRWSPPVETSRRQRATKATKITKIAKPRV